MPRIAGVSSSTLTAANESTDAARRTGAWLGLIGALLAAAWLWFAVFERVNLERAWGWDESMHAELPAARMLEYARAGEWRSACAVAVQCDRYPFVVPVYLAAVESVFGVSENVARHALVALWCVGLLGLGALVGRCALPKSLHAAPFVLAALFVSTTSLSRMYGATLFLEAPFAAVSVLVMHAWLARGERRTWFADVLAGGAFTLAFFTKFNYGLLLGIGLALDAVAGLAAQGDQSALAWLRRLSWFAFLPVLAALWWFVRPWPGDFELGASHREAFVSFLSGNQNFPRVHWDVRVLDWTTLVFPLPFFVAGCWLVLSSVRRVTHPAVRLAWLVALAFTVPLTLHPFHLDRFLLPAALPFWALALSEVVTIVARAREHLLRTVLVAAGVLALSIGAGAWWEARVLDVLGLTHPDATIAGYQRQALAHRVSVAASDPLPTNGLRRRELERFLDLASAAAGPTARVGWLGMSSELSPAVLHLGLQIGRAHV
jgi:hypothetical protein